MASLLIHINFFLFLAIFTVALTLNRNFNTVLVGLTYMAPLIPHVGPLTALGLGPEITERFLLISCANLIFGTIEIVVFVLTVEPGDTPFDKEHLKQL
ncbi:MAG TPA: isoprenylcysteine carboxylmethyltransferase family protein, partial [Nitrospinaceae bacterium]|nr:isoprenylcysteine carboxylmethyltransferase family protein [Nitrospinaceae bacterium]